MTDFAKEARDLWVAGPGFGVHTLEGIEKFARRMHAAGLAAGLARHQHATCPHCSGIYDEAHANGLAEGLARAAEIARHAYKRWAGQDPCPVECDVTACEEIAEAILSASPPRPQP